MRIILDTDKKTITVPWNYQQKLDGINEIIMQVSNDPEKKKTFTGYIDELWNECIENSDRCVITGEKCVIGNSSELKNCVLLNTVQVPHYNYVGDSVLGNYAHMGAGSICSNLKSDGKNIVIHGDVEYETGLRKIGGILGDHADIGCGCVLNPGTVIGKNTSVYPLNALRGVFPEGCIVKKIDDVVKRR